VGQNGCLDGEDLADSGENEAQSSSLARSLAVRGGVAGWARPRPSRIRFLLGSALARDKDDKGMTSA
jgi:hypothetical protein